jgi:ParB/RepB/Spo0J family partition protein
MVPPSNDEQLAVDPRSIVKNPNNPRLYFNDERLDQLRTSLQETGVLVPLIVYRDPEQDGRYVLLDGERRWRSALDLGFSEVPVRVTDTPSPVENVLTMFNIHAVREEWSLVAIALSLREVMRLTGEQAEGRLAEMTGLTRSTVRRAKRLLSLPEGELDLIQKEAHLDRNEQVHREDLYLEIERAESVLRKAVPEIANEFSRPEVIRQFARKREEGSLRAVTDFRDVGKFADVAKTSMVDRESIVRAARNLVKDVEANPTEVYEKVAARAYEQKELARRVELITESLDGLNLDGGLSEALKRRLESLRTKIEAILDSAGDNG